MLEKSIRFSVFIPCYFVCTAVGQAKSQFSSFLLPACFICQSSPLNCGGFWAQCGWNRWLTGSISVLQDSRWFWHPTGPSTCESNGWLAPSVRVVLLEEQTGRGEPVLQVIVNWTMPGMCLHHPPSGDPSGSWWLLPAPCVLACHAAGSCAQQPWHSVHDWQVQDKGCHSLPGSWLACRHQHIRDRKQSESAAAPSTLELPVPACLHPTQIHPHSNTVLLPGCLALGSTEWNTWMLSVVWKKKFKNQLHRWLIAAQLYRPGSDIQFVFILQLVLVFSSYRSLIQINIFSLLELASCQENTYFLLSATLQSGKTNSCSIIVG